jgi:hypothetical protein
LSCSLWYWFKPRVSGSRRSNDPDGKARLLDELPKNVEAMTYGFLENAETAIAILEARLTSVALAHDALKSGISDTILTAELQNHTAAIKPADGAVALVKLAANPRYSTFMAGPYGDSLAARFGVDPASLRRAALQTVADHGNPSQKAAAAAIGKLSKAARVHALSKAGTQDAVKRIRQRSYPAALKRGGPSSSSRLSHARLAGTSPGRRVQPFLGVAYPTNQIEPGKRQHHA